MSNRFVIHRHSGYGPPHYDFMLERGRVLASWQLTASPADLPYGQSLIATRLTDHRLLYLDYEGPISNGRGNVTIVDRGTCEIRSETPESLEISLAGEKTRGRFTLIRADQTAALWEMTAVSV